MASPGEEKLFLQALIQMAAGGVHLARGRPAPAIRLLHLALQKLERYPERFGDLDVGALRVLLREAPILVTTDPDRFLSALRSVGG
jgi:hypothetical protein